jgi:hypothetical protein
MFTAWYGIKANPFLVDTWSQGASDLILQTTVLSMAVIKIISLFYYDDGFDIPPGKVDVDGSR